MEEEVTKYDVLITAITNYSNELDEITNKIEKINLNDKEKEEFQSIIDSYDNNESLTEYLEKRSSTYSKRTKLYKYLQLYKKGISINEELSVLIETVANTDQE